MFKKLFKKIAKGIKKVAKKIVKVQKKVWKGIKKVGGKVMKAINKAGIVGQLGLMLVMPYAMSGLGSLVGNAAGGLSATWNGFGNWAGNMMGKSNVFAKAVGGIARGVYHAGATAGKIISGASKFINNGFKAIANATGLPNPIEGFSNAVQSGYTNSFQATNDFLFSGTKIGATSEQLTAAGVQPTTPTEIIPRSEVGKVVEKPKYTKEQAQTYLDNLTESDLKKLKEYQPDLYQNLQASVNVDIAPVTPESTLEKWGETAKDFVENKAGEYASKWMSNRIDESVYGTQETDTSIAFNDWERIGKTISTQNFFQRGDTYTPSLAAFYDEAENAFNPPRQGGFV
jgi:hypothetical protein